MNSVPWPRCDVTNGTNKVKILQKHTDVTKQHYVNTSTPKPPILLFDRDATHSTSERDETVLVHLAMTAQKSRSGAQTRCDHYVL